MLLKNKVVMFLNTQLMLLSFLLSLDVTEFPVMIHMDKTIVILELEMSYHEIITTILRIQGPT